MEKIRMHKKMAMTGKAPSVMKYKKGGEAKKQMTVKEITPKGRKCVLIYKGKAKDYKPVGKMGGGMMKPKKAVLGALIFKKLKNK